MTRYQIDPETGERVRVYLHIRNWRTYDPLESKGETYVGIISKTVPDMSLSMQEIVNRHVRGAELPDQGRFFNGDALFPDGTPMPDFARMSKAEIVMYAQENKIRVELIQQNMAELIRRKEQADAKAKDDELKKLRAENEVLLKSSETSKK